MSFLELLGLTQSTINDTEANHGEIITSQEVVPLTSTKIVAFKHMRVDKDPPPRIYAALRGKKNSNILLDLMDKRYGIMPMYTVTLPAYYFCKATEVDFPVNSASVKPEKPSTKLDIKQLLGPIVIQESEIKPQIDNKTSRRNAIILPDVQVTLEMAMLRIADANKEEMAQCLAMLLDEFMAATRFTSLPLSKIAEERFGKQLFWFDA